MYIEKQDKDRHVHVHSGVNISNINKYLIEVLNLIFNYTDLKAT